jgi:hypothetical protein
MLSKFTLSILAIFCLSLLNAQNNFVCGGLFTDTGGVNGNHGANENYTITICPNVGGEFVSLTFTQFNLEANWDRLYIYNSNTIGQNQISSPNGAGFGTCNTLAGGWWGNQLANQTITSTHSSGCLTFRFCSDATIQQSGWVANIICSPISASFISLTSFLDNNANGQLDNNEITFPFGNFNYEKNNDGNTVELTSSNGINNIIVTNPSDNYDVNFNLFSQYANNLNATVSSFQNVNTTNGNVNLFFPVVVTNPFLDVEVNLLPISQPRAGFNYINRIIYKNSGTIATSGTINFTKDPITNLISVNEATAVTNSNGFTFEYTNLLPFETRSIDVVMFTPPIPIVTINQLLTNTVSITPIENDINELNNTESSRQPVIAAYDPNDKMESRGRRILFEDFDLATDDFIYTIRFENEGNASAIDVRVEDTLHTQLDETTVRMVAASHNYVLQRIGNQLTWRFNNIQLPVSVPNTQIGHGYITFKIKLKPGIQVGSLVPNKASIYFDTNPPIITDEFVTEFYEVLQVDAFQQQVSFYPNPATNQFFMTSKSEIISWELYNVEGRKLQENQKVNLLNTLVDIEKLAAGAYFIHVKTIDSQAKIKLIKQ